MMRLLLPLVFCLSLVACRSEPAQPYESAPPNIRGTITLGSKSLTEQYLLMKMSALLLKDEGYKVNEMVFLDSQAVRTAMEARVADLYWEYTSTARIYYHKRSPLYNPEESYREVSLEDAKKGIVWLPKSSFNSSWALLMRKDISEQLHIYKISDLANYIRTKNPKMKFATNNEYLGREDGLERLKHVYEFSLSASQVVAIESDLLTQTVKDGRVDVAVGMASDPRIKKNDLILLEDDRKVFPPYDAAPVILETTLKRYPDIARTLERLTPYITNENMLSLMYQVDILQKDITKTSRDFLIKNHLLQS
ncbi:glycine/betaine ABC transporter substrate-binding protein [Cohnella endophytica]|uniref:Glycine/betaine ABC transporter substrate-binding protein n=1 Tax=Cohnella endophytica TaxID=2419778 RepID=A0A494XJC8_9BACL|nr:glycine betaine ABC transporter substrate-binding protein [Cohnella endophytica]RKP48756.1 glycine/betaine ABC transporter substrate-binding protein [Cohnella endophytica]